jgi:hypothetical protein
MRPEECRVTSDCRLKSYLAQILRDYLMPNKLRQIIPKTAGAASPIYCRMSAQSEM